MTGCVRALGTFSAGGLSCNYRAEDTWNRIAPNGFRLGWCRRSLSVLCIHEYPNLAFCFVALRRLTMASHLSAMCYSRQMRHATLNTEAVLLLFWWEQQRRRR